MFDFLAHFCHSAPMETHAFGFRLPANAPEGQKRFPISLTVSSQILSHVMPFVKARRRREDVSHWEGKRSKSNG